MDPEQPAFAEVVLLSRWSGMIIGRKTVRDGAADMAAMEGSKVGGCAYVMRKSGMKIFRDGVHVAPPLTDESDSRKG